MISLLISLEFRFDFGLTEKEMNKLLQAASKKRENTEYANKKAAKAICNSTIKPLLTKNLFYRELTMEEEEKVIRMVITHLHS